MKSEIPGGLSTLNWNMKHNTVVLVLQDHPSYKKKGGVASIEGDNLVV